MLSSSAGVPAKSAGPCLHHNSECGEVLPVRHGVGSYSHASLWLFY